MQPIIRPPRTDFVRAAVPQIHHMLQLCQLIVLNVLLVEPPQILQQPLHNNRGGTGSSSGSG